MNVPNAICLRRQLSRRSSDAVTADHKKNHDGVSADRHDEQMMQHDSGALRGPAARRESRI